MRFYAFGNFYLSSIQQSIQAFHACQEIYNNYCSPIVENQKIGISNLKNLDFAAQYNDWSKNHKTVVLLNGGTVASLKEIESFFKMDGNIYAHGSFYEEAGAISVGENQALTSVGIILPERIYRTAESIREREVRLEDLRVPTFSLWEIELIQMLNTKSLAR